MRTIIREDIAGSYMLHYYSKGKKYKWGAFFEAGNYCGNHLYSFFPLDHDIDKPLNVIIVQEAGGEETLELVEIQFIFVKAIKEHCPTVTNWFEIPSIQDN